MVLMWLSMFCLVCQAYGEPDEKNVLTIPKEQVVQAVGESQTVVGTKLMVGQGLPATITDVTDSEVTIDANHPLAGVFNRGRRGAGSG
jgi:FKBP-type peptidyl-prolyl cis-trans isomerase 2